MWYRTDVTIEQVFPGADWLLGNQKAIRSRSVYSEDQANLFYLRHAFLSNQNVKYLGNTYGRKETNRTLKNCKSEHRLTKKKKT